LFTIKIDCIEPARKIITAILLFFVEEDQHNFKSLSSLKEEIRTYLQTQLQATTEKINEVYDLDKKIWRELDDQEQTCEKLVKQIRKLRKEGVSLYNHSLTGKM